jgi:hypothetical protein
MFHYKKNPSIYCPLATNKQDRQCTHNVTLEVRSYDHCCSVRAMSITYCECVFVALGIQHAIYNDLNVKCSLLSTNFNENFNFLENFRKNLKYQIL